MDRVWIIPGAAMAKTGSPPEGEQETQRLRPTRSGTSRARESLERTLDLRERRVLDWIAMAARKPRTPKRTIAVPMSTGDLPASRAMLGGVRDELIERLAAFDARFVGLGARFDEFKHDVGAAIARIGVLVEEQNTRNAIVLEAIRAMIDRQHLAELRIDGVEATVQSLASGAPR
jgi:hypothetical protein